MSTNPSEFSVNVNVAWLTAGPVHRLASFKLVGSAAAEAARRAITEAVYATIVDCFES